MGGECYKYLHVTSPKDTTAREQEAFQALHPALLRLVNKWRSGLPNPQDWVFNQRKQGELCRVEFVGKHSDRFPHPIVLPRKLEDGIRVYDGMWRVGWQHRCYGTYRDPAEELAETLIAALASSPIGNLLELDQMDCIREDLDPGWGKPDDYNSYDDDKDFAACDKECGYCGHCPY